MSEVTTLDEPVRRLQGEEAAQLQEGTAICLSGGGYRAMLFHAGSLWRLHVAGILADVDRISSVSGGSITAGVLALAWPELFKGGSFENLVVAPVRALARRTIDVGAVIGGAFGPGSIGDRVVDAYRKYLFQSRTLQDLPDKPRFVFNATNVQSGALWRFSKPYMCDYRVGRVNAPRIDLAVAVGASSAFPPFLSPAHLELKEGEVVTVGGEDLHFVPYTTDVVLTDGGVYDNMGLETAWKLYRTILVSDAGGKLAAEPDPKGDWARHTVRVLDLIDNQVRSLRKRQVIGSFETGARKGTYWGIRTDIADYKLPGALPCPHDLTMELAAVKTRLARIEERWQERLINWGWAVTDAALRKHVNTTMPAGQFPYPRGVDR